MKIGILGGGQLGQMMVLSGYPLGMRFRVFDPDDKPLCADLASHTQGSYDDLEALKRFADGLDVVTYEFENITTTHLQALANIVPVHPSVQALEISQDRFLEKSFFAQLGARTCRFQTVDCLDDLRAGVKNFGFPCILKTRRFGYDGKGQALIRSEAELEAAFQACGGQNLILESFVPFKRELSVLAVRGTDGSTGFYPISENRHRGGILRHSIAPAPQLSQELTAQAYTLADRAMKALDYAGLFTIELFEVDDGIVVNEMAPRVHNSGHWTIEGAVTSQFENHLRAISGLPLGPCQARQPSLMLNIIGHHPSSKELLLKAPQGCHLHSYGKADRPGRKLGHLTYCAERYDMLADCIETLKGTLDI